MLYPYKQGSASAKALADALGVRRIRLEGSMFKGDKSKVVVNWGSSTVSEEVSKCMVLNKPEAVAIAANKRLFFERVATLGAVNIPEFTTDKDVAYSWVEDGRTVISREKLTGHSAEGLVVLDGEEDWAHYNHNAAKLYVKYIPKKDEFRVHVVCGEVVDIRRKSLNSSVNPTNVNWKVRNHANGFIFAKEGFETPDEVLQESLKAVALCGLDFGAVDVIWNNFRQKAYVLEVNTAPGLEGSTIDSYAEGFRLILEDEKEAKKWEGDMVRFRNELLTMSEMPAPVMASVISSPWFDDSVQMSPPSPS